MTTKSIIDIFNVLLMKTFFYRDIDSVNDNGDDVIDKNKIITDLLNKVLDIF